MSNQKLKCCTLFIVLVLFLNGLVIKAQLPEQIDLKTAIQIAIENNLEVRLAKIDQQIARNANHLGEAGFLPSVNMDINAFESSQDINLTFFSGEQIARDNAASRGVAGLIRADWTLFDGMRMFATKDRLETMEEMSKQQVKLKAEEVIAAVISEYTDILNAEKLAQFYLENSAYTRRVLQIAEDKFRGGITNRTEVLRLTADYYADSSMVVKHKLEIYQRKMRFCQRLGVKPNADFELSQIDWTPDFNLGELQNAVSLENPEILMQRLAIRSAEDQMKEQRSFYLPTLGTFGEYLNNRQINEVGILERNFSTGFNYGLRVQWTLFNANRTNRLMQERRFVLSQMQLGEEDLRQRLEGEIMNLWQSWLGYQRIYAIELAGLKLAEENLKLSIDRFERGIGEDIDVREALKNTTQAQLRLLEAESETYKTAAEILKISGKGHVILLN